MPSPVNAGARLLITVNTLIFGFVTWLAGFDIEALRARPPLI